MENWGVSKPIVCIIHPEVIVLKSGPGSWIFYNFNKIQACLNLPHFPHHSILIGGGTKTKSNTHRLLDVLKVVFYSLIIISFKNQWEKILCTVLLCVENGAEKEDFLPSGKKEEEQLSTHTHKLINGSSVQKNQQPTTKFL